MGEMGTAHAGKPPSLPSELRTPLAYNCFPVSTTEEFRKETPVVGIRIDVLAELNVNPGKMRGLNPPSVDELARQFQTRVNF
jgi:hypothetical protein